MGKDQVQSVIHQKPPEGPEALMEVFHLWALGENEVMFLN